MKTLDPLDHIRAHPEMYLPGGQPDPSDFASRLAGDAMTLGASRTLAIHSGAWWAVAADVDWLASHSLPIHDLFRQTVPFPESGPNSMRSEVLLGAFAQDIVTWSGGTPEVLKGRMPIEWPLIQVQHDPAYRRVVAFQLEPALAKNTLVKNLATH